MQKLSQTEELARSLAAKAHRHTLTTEQISRAMEEADFDIAQLDELYAALEAAGRSSGRGTCRAACAWMDEPRIRRQASEK